MLSLELKEIEMQEVEVKENRICIKCNVEKQITDFIKDKSRSSGYHPYCRTCQNEYKNRNRALNIKRAISWNKDNPEKRSKIRKTWSDKNNEKCRIYQYNRRALVKSLSDGTVTPTALLNLPKDFCGICNERLDWSNPTKIHLDHIVPLSKGGLNSITNVQWSHAKCNLSKGSK